MQVQRIKDSMCLPCMYKYIYVYIFVLIIVSNVDTSDAAFTEKNTKGEDKYNNLAHKRTSVGC